MYPTTHFPLLLTMWEDAIFVDFCYRSTPSAVCHQLPAFPNQPNIKEVRDLDHPPIASLLQIQMDCSRNVQPKVWFRSKRNFSTSHSSSSFLYFSFPEPFHFSVSNISWWYSPFPVFLLFRTPSSSVLSWVFYVP